jgi:hypothetical protein
VTGAERALLRAFGRLERPVAWTLFGGAVATFIGVLTGLIATGEFRLLTLVASADLGYAGYSALRDAYDSEEETG